MKQIPKGLLDKMALIPHRKEEDNYRFGHEDTKRNILRKNDQKELRKARKESRQSPPQAP